MTQESFSDCGTRKYFFDKETDLSFSIDIVTTLQGEDGAQICFYDFEAAFTLSVASLRFFTNVLNDFLEKQVISVSDSDTKGGS